MLRDNEHYRAPLLWLLIPFALGLVCTWSQVAIPGTDGMLAALAMVLAVAAWWISRDTGRRGRIVIIWTFLTISAAFLGGALRMRQALQDESRWRELPPREAILEMEITRVFSRPAESNHIALIGRVTGAQAHLADLAGQRVFVSAEDDRERGPLLKSARIRIKGVLEPLAARSPERGSFDAYLLSIAVPFRISRTRILDTVQPPSRLQVFWHRMGSRFAEILAYGLPEGHSGGAAYAAMMLGRKSDLSDGQREIFLHSGTMHLFAISGLHIGVIALGLESLLVVCRVPKRVAFVVGMVLLTVFVESTGGTPSERRALLMIGFLWAGTVMKRPANPLASLSASALFVLIAEPLALLSTSFQLSYAVVASILLYGVAMTNRLQPGLTLFRDVPLDEWRWWQRAANDLLRTTVALFCVSFAAMLVSAPLGLDAFGVTAPVALATNLLIMPMAALAISAGFVSLVVGLLGVLPLSTLFNHAAVLIIEGISGVAGTAAALPFSHWNGHFLRSWMAPVLVAGVIGIGIAGYADRWRRTPWALWTMPAVVALLMVLLVRWE